MDRAPFFTEVSRGPEGGAAYWLTTEDGLKIRIGVWAPEDPKGTFLVFPGRTEYVEKYGVTAAMLAKCGYASVAVDWRGQGLAERMLQNRATGHVLSFADYQKDITAILAAVEELGLPKPLGLVAHSMGGCIGMRALHQGLPVQAVTFTGPMWGIRITPPLRPVAWGLSTLSRPLRFGHIYPPGQVAETYVLRAPFEDNTLTSDPEMFQLMKDQLEAHPDLALGGPSLHWLNEALYEMRSLAALPSPSVPALTFVGSNERIVDVPRIHARMAAWPNGRLEVIDGGEHELLVERKDLRERVIEGAVALLEHVPEDLATVA
ncbi:alpha/beta hydrolase [Aestuariibius sp. 2305UL40-4]|uniref:alpha/beta hydrolase n=1 Tax=Aestuariibius violaceus TaxID=3234132 RepID=UPI00345EFFE6